METILEAVRSILGEPDFYKHLPGSSGTTYNWDYAAMFEYLIAGLILVLSVVFMFKLIFKLFEG